MPSALATRSSSQPLAAASSLPDSLNAETSLLALFEAVRTELKASLSDPASGATQDTFLSIRQEAARAVAQLFRKHLKEKSATAARELIREISQSGLSDAASTAEERELADELFASAPGGPGLLAAMMLLPAWQWPKAPPLAQVPDVLWGDYAAWLFTAPQGFCAPGQAEAFAQHTLRRLEELLTWVERNAGSPTVRAALDAYVRVGSSIPLYFANDSLRRHAELRGRLLTRAVGAQRDTFDPLAEPRVGRRLRVGFVNRHFGPQTETYTTLPTFEQLDPERFEVHLFAHRLTDTPLEAYCRQHTHTFHLLPDDVGAQLDTLRNAQLDVVVFGTNVTAVFNEVTRLALYRSAPLQVVNNSSCITSGLPHVDLYVSGDLTETAEACTHFSERLGLLPGAAHAFNYDADRQEPTTAWTRALLGIPDDAVVFVTAANYFKIIPEMRTVWARLLAAVPGSHLVVHPFNPNWSSTYPIQRFDAEFSRTLAAHGVEATRLHLSTEKFPSRADVKALLSVGDVYLDTFPFGGVNSLIDPLELGLPTLTWEGDTFRSRMGAALLRQLALPELIHTDEAAYLATAQRLGQDHSARAALRNRITLAMERNPRFLDSLAASETLGDLLETAFDRLVAAGLPAFRADPTPLRAENATPLDVASRHAHGRELLRQGRAARAVDYLTAAVLQNEGDARLWFDLAGAFRQSRQFQSAIQALEASLRLDATQIEGWILLVELAEGGGLQDLAREALGVALEIAPADPRVMQLATRTQAA